MTTRATLVIGYAGLLNNRLFSPALRDNQSACFVALRAQLLERDIDLCTEDIHRPEDVPIVLYIDPPTAPLRPRSRQIRYLLLTEPPVVAPQNWPPERHAGFDRVFTWNDTLVDGVHYFLLRFAYHFELREPLVPFAQKKLCTMVAGYKFSRQPCELYTERYDVVRWFDRFHHDDFEFFGIGWPDRLVRSPLGQRLVRWRAGALFPRNRTYRGSPPSKVDTLRAYRFSICYENMRDMQGYVTEKIFDCFSAGCVPIYWGASNIRELIPESCYIDRRAFRDNDALYTFLKSVDADRYESYLAAIRDFLRSEASHVFTPAHYAMTLTTFMLGDLARLG